MQPKHLPVAGVRILIETYLRNVFPLRSVCEVHRKVRFEVGETPPARYTFCSVIQFVVSGIFTQNIKEMVQTFGQPERMHPYPTPPCAFECEPRDDAGTLRRGMYAGDQKIMRRVGPSWRSSRIRSVGDWVSSSTSRLIKMGSYVNVSQSGSLQSCFLVPCESLPSCLQDCGLGAGCSSKGRIH